jgi:hypothetical protein
VNNHLLNLSIEKLPQPEGPDLFTDYALPSWALVRGLFHGLSGGYIGVVSWVSGKTSDKFNVVLLTQKSNGDLSSGKKISAT